MTNGPLSRRLFIAKAAPLIAATTMPAVLAEGLSSKPRERGETKSGSTVATGPRFEPVEHMRAILQHFATQAPDASRFMVQIGGTRETVGYAAYAYVSSWVPDARLRGGGYYRDDATELSRRSYCAC
jgi:hypothetical protein